MLRSPGRTLIILLVFFVFLRLGIISNLTLLVFERSRYWLNRGRIYYDRVWILLNSAWKIELRIDSAQLVNQRATLRLWYFRNFINDFQTLWCLFSVPGGYFLYLYLDEIILAGLSYYYGRLFLWALLFFFY